MSRMTSCRACGGMIAASATTCPRCGAILNRISIIPVGLIIMLVIAVVCSLTTLLAESRLRTSGPPPLTLGVAPDR
jgi:hypothetical protein